MNLVSMLKQETLLTRWMMIYKIKPLKWVWVTQTKKVFANTIIGYIECDYDEEDDGTYCFDVNNHWELNFRSMKEAKKAAEEYYYNKLKEALIEVNDEQ